MREKMKAWSWSMQGRRGAELASTARWREALGRWERRARMGAVVRVRSPMRLSWRRRMRKTYCGSIGRLFVLILGRVEWVAEGDPFFDGAAFEEVFLDDAGDAVWGCVGIPDAVGVNQKPGAVFADAEAEGFGAEGWGVGLGDEGFEGFPGLFADLGGAALWACAEEGVAGFGGEGELADGEGWGGIGHG